MSTQARTDVDAATGHDISAAKPSWTLAEIIANLDRKVWGWDGPVAFSFFVTKPASANGDADYEGFSAFTAEQMNAARLAFDLIADVANITFVEMADNGSSDDRITFANSDTMPDFVWGWASTGASGFPGQRWDITGSEIWVNTDEGLSGYYNGGYNLSSMIHEIMHALGVAHPGEYNADGDPITYEDHAEYELDSGQYTVMSYFGAHETGANHMGWYASTPLLHDIAVLQHIYGANMSTRAGDTVYGFGSNAGRSAFDFSQNAAPVVAIWDGGGTDEINLSGYAMDCVLDLREGHFSNVGGLTGNLTIAYGAVIENAVGGLGADTIYGNDANNRINGGLGADTMAGGLGDDIYYVDNLGDVVIENSGEGTDQIRTSMSYSLSGAHVEVLALTGSGDINGTGNSLANRIVGNSGKNVLDGGTNADELEGRDGDDTYYVDHAGDNVVEVKNEGHDHIFSSVSYSLNGRHVEDLTLTGTGDLNATGNSLANRLVGNSGDNVLDGGTNGDRMEGGLGDDTYYVDHINDQAIEAKNQGYDIVFSSISFSLEGSHLDRLNLTGTGDIDGTGNSLDNVMLGNNGNNVLNGGTGHDVINGAKGADTMIGGRGNDTFRVDNAGDVIVEFKDEGTDLVTSTVSFSLAGAHVENLTLQGTDNLNATGNSLANVLTGNSGNNTLDGGTGSDTMIGGKGNDLYFVERAGDVVIEAKNEGTDTVRSTVSYSLSGQHIENLTLLGTGNLNATGNSLANQLTGTSGKNVLDGGTGNDRLVGKGGADTFVIRTKSGDDEIADFQNGVDVIRFISVAGVNSFADIDVAANGDGWAVISWGGSDSITLTGVTAGQVDASDFQFSAPARADARVVEARTAPEPVTDAADPFLVALGLDFGEFGALGQPWHAFKPAEPDLFG